MQAELRERLRTLIDQDFARGIKAKEVLRRTAAEIILDMAGLVAQAFRGKHRLFLFGNGGSAGDAQHLAAEFVNRFRRERPPLPALALTVDTSVLTSISNDSHFEEVFVRQLQALAQPGDVVLGISTSGSSENVVRALRWAREHGIHTLGWAGAGQAEMDSYCDLLLHAPSRVTAHVQECHLVVGHILCNLVDELLFGETQSAS